jgi:hypothetical protein
MAAKTDWSNYQGISLLSNLYKILSNILLSRLIGHADKTIRDTSVDFYILDQSLMRFSVSGRCCREKGVQ